MLLTIAWVLGTGFVLGKCMGDRVDFGRGERVDSLKAGVCEGVGCRM